MKIATALALLMFALLSVFACTTKPIGVETNPAVQAQQAPSRSFDDRIEDHGKDMMKEGRRIFRYDTFGSEDFWGGKLRLHEAIALAFGRSAG